LAFDISKIFVTCNEMRFVSLKFSVDFVVVQIAANPLLVNTKIRKGCFHHYRPRTIQNGAKQVMCNFIMNWEIAKILGLTAIFRRNAPAVN